MWQSRVRRFTPALALQIGVLIVLVFPFVSATFRDNDQATILGSSLQLARRQTPFLHAIFYNFDKQWGVFLALSWLFRLFPHADPILAANILLTLIASAAWISLGRRTGRTRHAPLPLLLPVLLSPVLILYIPYLGTGWFSLAFLLLAFFFLGNVRSKPSQLCGLFCVAVAAACRGDVVLAVPALALSLMSRAPGFGLLRRPLPWLLGIAAIAPVLVGKWMAGTTIDDTNPLSFDLKSYFGFVLFGLTPATLALLILIAAVFLSLAARKPRFWLFYGAVAVAPLIPFGFYSMQLYTLRYFFLTIASVLFVASSRRSVLIYRANRQRRRMASVLVALTVAPWIIGLQAPLLNHIRLTATNPTRFPTGDGTFPMGAYLGFESQVLFEDHGVVDHNQEMWLAARSVRYETCSDGTVPFLITPMSNYLEFAIRVQNKNPNGIDYLAESSCGIAYVDARSVIRGYRPVPRDGAFFKDAIAFASATDNGQIILRIDAKSGQTQEGIALQSLRETLGEREVQIYNRPLADITIEPGIRYAVFSQEPCQVSLNGRALPGAADMVRAAWTGVPNAAGKAQLNCPGRVVGWARTALPPYMGL